MEVADLANSSFYWIPLSYCHQVSISQRYRRAVLSLASAATLSLVSCTTQKFPSDQPGSSGKMATFDVIELAGPSIGQWLLAIDGEALRQNYWRSGKIKVAPGLRKLTYRGKGGTSRVYVGPANWTERSGVSYFRPGHWQTGSARNRRLSATVRIQAGKTYRSADLAEAIVKAGGVSPLEP